MVKAVEPDKIPITSTAQLTAEFTLLLTALAKEETEHTWEQIDKALRRFQAVIRGGACKFTDEFVRQMRAKEVVVGIVRSMETERTRLSATTLLLLSSLTRLGPSFAPLLPLFLPPLLRLLCRTNKLYLSRTASTLSSIVVHTRLPEILKFVVGEWKAEGGKSASYRTGATAVVLSMLEGGEEMAVEKDGIERRMDELEWVIRTGATDKEQKVRAEIKKVWEVYKQEWPERIAGFTGPMTPVIRRYLAISGVASSIPPRAAAPLLKKPKVPSALQSYPPLASKPLASSLEPSKSLSASVGPSKSASTNALSKSVSSGHILSKSVSGPSTSHGLSKSTSSAHHPLPGHTAFKTVPPPRPEPRSASSSRPPSRTEERPSPHAPTRPARTAFAPSRPPTSAPIEKRRPQRFVPPPPPLPAKSTSTNALSRSTTAPSRTALSRSTSSRPPTTKPPAPTTRPAVPTPTARPVGRTNAPFRPTSSAKMASRLAPVSLAVRAKKAEEVPLPCSGGEDSIELPASSTGVKEVKEKRGEKEVDEVLEARLEELVRCTEVGEEGDESAGFEEGGMLKGLMEESMMMGEEEEEELVLVEQVAVAEAHEDLVDTSVEEEVVEAQKVEVVKAHEDLVDIAFVEEPLVDIADSSTAAIEEQLAQVEEELVDVPIAEEELVVASAVEEDAAELEEELLETAVEEQEEEEREIVAEIEAVEEEIEVVAEIEKEELVDAPTADEEQAPIVDEELAPVIEEQLVEVEAELLEAEVEEEREMVAEIEEVEEELAVVEEIVVAQEYEEEEEMEEELEAVEELVLVKELVVAQEVEEKEVDAVVEEELPAQVIEEKLATQEDATSVPLLAPSSPSPTPNTHANPLPSPTFSLSTPPLSTQSFLAQMASLSPEPFHTRSMLLSTPPSLRPAVHLPFQDTSPLFLPDEAEVDDDQSFDEEDEVDEVVGREFEVPLNDAEDEEDEEEGEGWVDEMAPTVIFSSRLAPAEEEAPFEVDASELVFEEEEEEQVVEKVVEEQKEEQQVEEVVVLKRSLRNREVVVEVGRTPGKTPSRSRSTRDVLGEVQL